jgi:hypothetical protein
VLFGLVLSLPKYQAKNAQNNLRSENRVFEKELTIGTEY